MYFYQANPRETFALRDLIAALHWVKNNIEVLGGDPTQITVAG
ncbi:carboxylesterase family protein [Brevibacillus laterosporus]